MKKLGKIMFLKKTELSKMINNPNRIRYKDIDVRCPFCGVKHAKEAVPADSEESFIERVCSKRVCRRQHEWMLASDSEQIRKAVMLANVGELYIRDGKLPTLANFTPNLSLQWDRSSYICGPSDSGKTWALCAIACDALANGRSAKVLNWVDFQIEVRNTYQPAAKETELDILTRYIRPDVLCFDDIGAGKRTAKGQESEAARVLLYALINKRYYRNFITHFSSNVEQDKLAGIYDERIAHRIRFMSKEIVLKKIINK